MLTNRKTPNGLTQQLEPSPRRPASRLPVNVGPTDRQTDDKPPGGPGRYYKANNKKEWNVRNGDM